MEPQFCGQTEVLNRVPENEKGHSIRPSPQHQHPRQCPPKDARKMFVAPEKFIGGRTRHPSQSCTQDMTPPLPCHASSLLPVDSRADVMLCWVKKVSPAHASSSSAGFRMARLRASVAWHKKDENIHHPTAWHARPCRQPSRTSSSQPPRLCTRPILSAMPPNTNLHEPLLCLVLRTR